MVEELEEKNEVKPLAGGRWVWPFRQMEPGDWFFVRHEHRDPENVRQMASVRGAQLGKHFSVEKNWKQGVLKVTCVEEGHKQYNRAPEVLDYGAACEVIGRSYGVDAAQLAWTMLDVGNVHRLLATQVEKPYRTVYEATIPPSWKFILELQPDGFSLTRVEKWVNTESFVKAQLEEVMS